MTRGTEMTVNLAHSIPIDLRHKWDGCFEMFQEDDQEYSNIIHIEQEDMPAFVEAFKIWYDRITRMTEAKESPGFCQYSAKCDHIATATIDTVLGDVEVCRHHKDFYEGMDKPKGIPGSTGLGYHDQN